MCGRTFLEQDVNANKLRPDLLQKMAAVDPSEPTAQEREHGITKMRYMQFRERASSSHTLGFRIEAMKAHDLTEKVRGSAKIAGFMLTAIFSRASSPSRRSQK